MPRLIRSTSIRLTLVFAGLFIFASLMLAGVLWWESAAYLERETDAVVIADTQAIGDRLRDFGLAGAVQTISERVAQTADEHAIYFLATPSLDRVAGNLSAWPADVGNQEGWYQTSLVREGRAYPARVLHVGLRGGFQLLVGRDIANLVAIRTVLFNALTWAALAAVGLAVGGGLLVRRAVLGRVAQVNRTTAAIVQGDLSQRLTVGDGDDEFGRLARTINEMLAQIELLIDGVRNASNAVAHDLRTPLAELRARLEAIDGRMPAPDARDEIQGAIADVDRLVGVFNALLRLAAIDSGARRAGFRTVALAPLVAQVVEVYGALADAEGATLVVDAAEVSVTGDPDMLAQAIANLLDNAIKYAAAGSNRATITLTISRREDGLVAIAVADNGPGVPESEREKVVERFHRGDASRGSPGLGLGLAEVAAVAKLHGGTFELAENHPGLRATLLLRADAPALALPPAVPRVLESRI
jgi:signal transduction histidine kinase